MISTEKWNTAFWLVETDHVTLKKWKNSSFRSASYRESIGRVGNISKWEFEVGNELGNRINQFINKLDQDLLPYSNNEAIYVIRNNQTTGIYRTEFGTASTLQSQKVKDKLASLRNDSFPSGISFILLFLNCRIY